MLLWADKWQTRLVCLLLWIQRHNSPSMWTWYKQYLIWTYHKKSLLNKKCSLKNLSKTSTNVKTTMNFTYLYLQTAFMVSSFKCQTYLWRIRSLWPSACWTRTAIRGQSGNSLALHLSATIILFISSYCSPCIIHIYSSNNNSTMSKFIWKGTKFIHHLRWVCAPTKSRPTQLQIVMANHVRNQASVIVPFLAMHSSQPS